MHIAQETERQQPTDRDPVKAAPIRVIMSHDRAGEDLHQQKHGNDDKIFADAALARRQWAKVREQRIECSAIGFAEKALVDKEYRAQCKKEKAEADPGPDEGCGRRGVA